MDDARIGLVVDGRYRVEDRIAAGGMGVVYRAVRLGLDKPVAIKFLHRSQASVPHQRERFNREAAAMSRLSHPNLVSIIDYGDVDGAPYLVMEYQHGESLRRVLERGSLPIERVISIARQILAGLGSAHVSGVVHRDLKPDNVLLLSSADDIVKILDFGVAKLIEGDGSPSEMSVMARTILGTAAYMSPEQARGQAIDPRADLYAVGIMLYEMVVGRRPFEAERDLAVLRMQVEDPPLRPRNIAPEISPELEVVMLRALEKKRTERWETAEAFSAALAQTPEGRPPPASEPVRAALRDSAPSRKRSGGWASLVLAMMLLAVAGVSLLWVADDHGLIEVPWPEWFLRVIATTI
ncbi:MAG: serine/threonine protein kinase [Deltaproteobacteria bacterium]|nr:serine/threonine protein kinase [Deltaproteobacteria bacterium]